MNNFPFLNLSYYFYKHREFGKKITDFVWQEKYIEPFKKIRYEQSFCLKTVYPGLLVGSGYVHPAAKNDNDAYQLGFVFDYTTGLPIIPGSSIKGVLRSVCDHPDFANELFGIKNCQDYIKLFEDSAIFHDAYIVATDDNDSKIFGDDYITHHHPGDPMGAFKDPVPVRFLKILPGVTFKFVFGKIDEKTKDLFEKIITTIGLGAKTNVGYGQFVASNAEC